MWRRDGKELFFLGSDNSLMAVRFGGPSPFGTPIRLFQNDLMVNDVFDVSEDGQRFVAVLGSSRTLTAPFTVVLNWTADLKR